MTETDGIFWSFWLNCRSDLELGCTGESSWRTHFHLLMETPEANLSQTGQWLNVSYSVGFNRRHQRSGHLFQGRFGAVLVGGLGDWLEVARYVPI